MYLKYPQIPQGIVDPAPRILGTIGGGSGVVGV